MKLHELVQLRNELLESINLNEIQTEVKKNQSKLNTLVPLSYHYSDKITAISENHHKVILQGSQDLENIKQLVNEINNEIFSMTRKFFADNYQTECQLMDPSRIRQDKILNAAEGSNEILLNRIYLHSTWEYPALEIGCRDGEWTKQLINFDPLYVADLFDEFVNSAVSQFTPEYQLRVRKYKISKNYLIPGLPTNQFGFIFSYNFFNYLSLDSIKQLLQQSMELLRPGGTMIFTYNNADLSASAGLCNDYFMSYVPKSMLLPMIESIGFEMIHAPDYLPSTSWVEIRKPGTLKTVKAHQVLGEIKYL